MVVFPSISEQFFFSLVIKASLFAKNEKHLRLPMENTYSSIHLTVCLMAISQNKQMFASRGSGFTPRLYAAHWSEKQLLNS